MGNSKSKGDSVELNFNFQGSVRKICIPKKLTQQSLTQIITKQYGLDPKCFSVRAIQFANGGPVVPFTFIERINFDELPPSQAFEFCIFPTPVERPLILPSAAASFEDLISSNSEAMRRVTHELHKAGHCRISMRDHPEYSSLREQLYDTWLAFCDQPIDKKRKFHRRLYSEKFVGFSKQPSREFFQVRSCTLSSWSWPSDPPEFTNAALRMYSLLEEISKLVLGAVANTLGLDPRVFLDLLDPEPLPNESYGSNVFRIYKYYAEPEKPKDKKMMPCGTHADLGLITAMPVSTASSFRALQGHNLEWVMGEEGVDPWDVLIFTGETLGYLTQGYIRSALHQVIPVFDKPRISTPFFLRANPEKLIEPLDFPALHSEPQPNFTILPGTKPAKGKQKLTVHRGPKLELGGRLTVHDFMTKYVFRVRPWQNYRRGGKNTEGEVVPDY